MGEADLREALADSVKRALDGRCPTCLRRVATDHDWEYFGGGEGAHLCWENPGTCSWAPDPSASRATLIADALLAGPLAEHGRQVRAEALEKAADAIAVEGPGDGDWWYEDWLRARARADREESGQ